MSYLVLDYELDSLPSRLSLPPGYRGVALVLRSDRIPVDFVMVESKAGGVVSFEDVKQRIGPVERRPPVAKELPGVHRVTIAVCTRNRAKQLKRCLEALLALDPAGFDLELIVVDNAPTDDQTSAVVSEFPRIRYLVEPRPGLSCARNCAIRAATGELIAFTDDDVIPDREWLIGLKTAFQENPQAVAASGPIMPFELETEAQILYEGRGGFGRTCRKFLFTANLPGTLPTYPCGEACFGAGANMAFRRDLFERIGTFDEALGPGTFSGGADDLEVFYRVIRAGLLWAYEPQMMVFHQHRRELTALAWQAQTWCCGTVSYMVKSYQTDPAYRGKIVRFLLRLLTRKIGGLIASAIRVRPYRWPVSLAWAELYGALEGFTAYRRSLRQMSSLESA